MYIIFLLLILPLNFYPHKGEKIHYISIERGGIDSPNVRLNKNNIRVFSDSVYSELMKVYSLKSDTDSIVIKINIDGSKNHIHKIGQTHEKFWIISFK